MLGQAILKQKALEILRERGVVRLKEFREEGVPSMVLKRLKDEGVVEARLPGVYVLADGALSPDLPALVAERKLRTPLVQPVLCLLSAASRHGLITRDPSQVWLAVPYGYKERKLARGLVRFVRWDAALFYVGVKHEVLRAGSAEREVLITTPARTVVDLFRHRDIDRATAVEAMQKALADGTSQSEIEEMAAAIGRNLPKQLAPYLAGAVPAVR